MSERVPFMYCDHLTSLNCDHLAFYVITAYSKSRESLEVLAAAAITSELQVNGVFNFGFENQFNS